MEVSDEVPFSLYDIEQKIPEEEVEEEGDKGDASLAFEEQIYQELHLMQQKLDFQTSLLQTVLGFCLEQQSPNLNQFDRNVETKTQEADDNGNNNYGFSNYGEESNDSPRECNHSHDSGNDNVVANDSSPER